ncbi:hypothetical protein [Streptomyces sp. NPDC014806]|uniref:hypothetical protein n=1 Tax=Streptomyces sp. NPDC014806 TaxID=3364920 RepID=UPI0037002DA7
MPRLSVIVRVAAPPPRRALVRCGLRRTVRALRLTAAAGRRAGRLAVRLGRVLRVAAPRRPWRGCYDGYDGYDGCTAVRAVGWSGPGRDETRLPCVARVARPPERAGFSARPRAADGPTGWWVVSSE